MSPLRTLRHSATLTWRNLLRIKHSPDMVLDVITQPIIFVVLFVFLFGNAVAGNWHTYLNYLLPGLAVQSLMLASMATGIGLNADVRNGNFDRFRSMPIARTAPLIGQITADVCRYVIALVLLFGFGVILGFRSSGSVFAVLGGCLLIMFFSFSVCWIAAFVGLVARSASSVQALSLALVLPLTFGSNVFVPTAQLPGWLQAWVKINPVTQLSDAVRALMLARPVGHAVLYSLLWTLAILAVFVPLAGWAYRRRV